MTDINYQHVDGSDEFKAVFQLLLTAVKRHIVTSGSPILVTSMDIDLMKGLSLLLVLRQGSATMEFQVAEDTSPEQDRAVRIILETREPL